MRKVLGRARELGDRDAPALLTRELAAQQVRGRRAYRNPAEEVELHREAYRRGSRFGCASLATVLLRQGTEGSVGEARKLLREYSRNDGCPALWYGASYGRELLMANTLAGAAAEQSAQAWSVLGNKRRASRYARVALLEGRGKQRGLVETVGALSAQHAFALLRALDLATPGWASWSADRGSLMAFECRCGPSAS